MQTKSLLYILASGMIAIVLLMGSCEKVVYPPIERPENVSYKSDVQTIWDAEGANCVKCHAGRSPILTPDVSWGELVNGGYVNTSDPANSTLIKKLESPHGETTEEQRLTILVWIEEGAKNN